MVGMEDSSKRSKSCALVDTALFRKRGEVRARAACRKPAWQRRDPGL